MKKATMLIALTLILHSSYSQTTETLQTVTENGNRTTRPIILTSSTANYTYIGGSDVGFARIGGYSTAGTPQNFIINQEGGNVGIGTISPAYRLDVNGTVKATNLYTSANEGYRIMHNSGFIAGYNGANDARSGYLQFNSGANVTLAAENAPALNLMTNSTPRLYIHSNGNIGIGTGSASVNYKVAINGSVNVNAAPLTITNSSSDNSIQLTSVGSNNAIASYNLAGGTPKTLLINPDGGNVGIGIASPAYKLDVNGEIHANRMHFSYSIPLYWGNVNGQSRFRWSQEDTDQVNLKLQYSKNSGTTWANGLTLNSSGVVKVGDYEVWHAGNLSPASYLPLAGGNITGQVNIGTTVSQKDLNVNGNIKTRKITVTVSNWADYVFDSSYQLTPLHQVEKFIQKNKHLPDVPSAVKVEKDGLDLGNNQAVLLKKIEELTLYIINQNKDVEMLKQKVEMLEAKAK